MAYSSGRVGDASDGTRDRFHRDDFHRRVTPEKHLEIVQTEGMRLAALPASSLADPVPALPEWTVERVIRHVGKIHQWVTALLGSPEDADVNAAASATKGMPRGPECLPAYRESLHEMLDAFAVTDPARPVASFIGPATVGFWARRQAHEVTVHRIDAADAVHAAGGATPEPVDNAGAVDGVDEWLEIFVSSTDAALHGCTVGIEVGDAHRWTVRFATDGPGCAVDNSASRDDVARSDVVLEGTPEAMLLTCWRRRPLDHLQVRGDHDLAEIFHDTLRF